MTNLIWNKSEIKELKEIKFGEKITAPLFEVQTLSLTLEIILVKEERR